MPGTGAFFSVFDQVAELLFAVSEEDELEELWLLLSEEDEPEEP